MQPWLHGLGENLLGQMGAHERLRTFYIHIADGKRKVCRVAVKLGDKQNLPPLVEAAGWKTTLLISFR